MHRDKSMPQTSRSALFLALCTSAWMTGVSAQMGYPPQMGYLPPGHPSAGFQARAAAAPSALDQAARPGEAPGPQVSVQQGKAQVTV
jgi:hypothetical protein